MKNRSTHDEKKSSKIRLTIEIEIDPRPEDGRGEQSPDPDQRRSPPVTPGRTRRSVNF